MNQVDDFFAEQDKRMSIPDEDVDGYIQMRILASWNKRSGIRHLSSAGGIPGSTNDGPRCKPSQQAISLAPCSSTNPRIQVEMGHAGTESNSVSLPLLPEPSSTPVSSFDVAPHPKRRVTVPNITVAARCAKRSKITGEFSVPKQMNCASRASPCDGQIVDPNTSRITTRGNGASVGFLLGTSVSQRDLRGTSGQNRLFGSTDLAPENNTLQSPMIQTTEPAVPMTEEGSAHASTARTNVVQKLKQKPITPPIFLLDNSSVMDVSSPPPVSSYHNAAVSSTKFDIHGNNSKFTQNSPHSSIPKGTLTPGVRPSIVVPPLPRLNDGSHEAVSIGEDPVPRTPAGFHTATNPDVSNITSPGGMSSGQFHHDRSGDAHEREERKAVKRTRIVSNGDGSSGKVAKDKPKLITPLEYAQRLQSRLPHMKPKTNYLKGKRIFYVGGDMMYASPTTRGRMDYVVKHGGTLVPKYDPTSVTHIVTDAGIRPTLHALSLKSLSDIPDNIPTVTWDWVVSGYGRARKQKSKLSGDGRKKNEEGNDDGIENDSLDFEFMHAAFSERINAGCNWRTAFKGNQGQKAVTDDANDDSGDISHISNFSHGSGPADIEGRGVSLTVLPPPPLDFEHIEGRKADGPLEEGRKASENEDPLSEYYAQARADCDAQWNKDASDSGEGDNDIDYRRGPAPRRGFACDTKGPKPVAVCVNQHIVDKLEELRELHKAKSSEDDRWRAYSYGKCIPALRNYHKPIRSFSEARSIRGVGEKTALKIMEIINTGDLQRIKYENTEEVAATRMFQGIYGVGRYTSFAWFASGLRTLDDVRARKYGLKLSTAQEIGLRFYDDINSRMSREEARKIFEMIKPIALAIDSKLFIEIMGSYRRGRVDCGDIDILITRPTMDGKTHQGMLRTLLEQLDAAGIITENLSVPDDFSDLELIYHGLCKLPESGAKRRRIDFLCVPWQSRGAALLYYTGDDIFNRAMRLKANKHGFSLNQRGLYAGVVRDPHNRQKKICEGNIVASETEEEIFNILGVPWQEPHERVRG